MRKKGGSRSYTGSKSTGSGKSTGSMGSEGRSRKWSDGGSLIINMRGCGREC